MRAHPTLEHLGVAGDGNKYLIGKEILPLFKALEENAVVKKKKFFFLIENFFFQVERI